MHRDQEMLKFLLTVILVCAGLDQIFLMIDFKKKLFKS
jgi:hypothetical protein